MNVYYKGYKFLFEWDSDKARANLDKHRISFEEGAEACEDPFALVEDATKENDEQREQFTGYSGRGRILVVVTVERGIRLRVISAREANRHERRTYEEKYRSL